MSDYNPISCNHKKPNGFTTYDMQSSYSASGPDLTKEVHISVCLNCGEIKIFGKELKGDHYEYFSEEFSIHHPAAVAAIVKNCNYMNSETKGYISFQQITI